MGPWLLCSPGIALFFVHSWAKFAPISSTVIIMLLVPVPYVRLSCALSNSGTDFVRSNPSSQSRTQWVAVALHNRPTLFLFFVFFASFFFSPSEVLKRGVKLYYCFLPIITMIITILLFHFPPDNASSSSYELVLMIQLSQITVYLYRTHTLINHPWILDIKLIPIMMQSPFLWTPLFCRLQIPTFHESNLKSAGEN